MDLLFPLGGVHRSLAYQSQSPFTCYDALNVRPRDALEGRLRGGSRPGLTKSSVTQLGGGKPINLLGIVRTLNASGGTVLQDIFNGSFNNQVLSQYHDRWDGGVTFINLVETTSGTVEELFIDSIENAARGSNVVSTYSSAALTKAICDAINDDESYVIIIQTGGPASGDAISILFVMDDDNPDRADSLEIKVTNTGANYQLRAYNNGVGGTTQSYTNNGNGELIVKWDPKTKTMGVSFGGANHLVFTVDHSSKTLAGSRIGIGFFNSSTSITRLNWFRLDYIAGDSSSLPPQAVVVASNGTFYYQATNGTVATVVNNTDVDGVTTTIQLAGVGRLQQFLIADYELRKEGIDGATNGGDTDKLTLTGFDNSGGVLSDGGDVIEITDVGSTTGTAGTYKFTSTTANPAILTLTPDPGFRLTADSDVEYRVVRAAKYFDASASGEKKLYRLNSKDNFASPVKQVPIGCDIMELYMDRVMMAGDPNSPQVLYASAVGDPTDFDTSGTNSKSAFAYSPTEFGVIGDTIRMLAAFGKSYLLIGCSNSIWVLRGNPRGGGRLDSVTRNSGIIHKGAWCHTPFGTVVALSSSGLIHILPNLNAEPEMLSRGRLPMELLAINTEHYDIGMAFDHRDQGIHIMVVPRSVGPTSYWWFDWETNSFWPVTLSSDHDPLAILEAKDATGADLVLYGCRDGYVRHHDKDAKDDDGTAFDNFASYGPIRLGDGRRDGMVTQLNAVLDQQSGDVDWEVVAASTAEEAVNDGTRDGWNGTWNAGRNLTDRPRARGGAFFLRLTGKGTPWAIESLAVQRRGLGRHRP